jgi:hypothetical protein
MACRAYSLCGEDCSYALGNQLTIPAGACPNGATNDVSVPLEKILPPVLILASVAALIAFLIWRRMQKSQVALREKLLNVEHVVLETQEQLISLRKVWEINWADLSVKDPIGSGANGRVFCGTWRDLSVAVKVLTASYLSVDELRKEMDHEATMLQTLRHAHVVQFYGVGLNPENLPFLVTELMELGALTDLLLEPQGRWCEC